MLRSMLNSLLGLIVGKKRRDNLPPPYRQTLIAPLAQKLGSVQDEPHKAETPIVENPENDP